MDALFDPREPTPICQECYYQDTCPSADLDRRRCTRKQYEEVERTFSDRLDEADAMMRGDDA